MSKAEERKIAQTMKQARTKSRGYADFFTWAPDRNLEELGVVVALAEAMEKNGDTLFHSIILRGRQNDPPDCEAMTEGGLRMAVEVTELVDGKAIQAYKKSELYNWAEWTVESFKLALENLISKKDDRFKGLKGTPYPGGYYVLIYTDEPGLNRHTVTNYLQQYVSPRPDNITGVYLLLSYDLELKSYPYFKIVFGSDNPLT
jgi:hypothetical protein